MKKLIILGASSYIGRNLIAALADSKDVMIYAMIREKAKDKLSCFSNQENIQICFFNFETLQNLHLADCEAGDCLFNFAWNGVETSDKNDVELQLANIVYAKHVLEFVNRHHIKRYLAIGSASECAYLNTPINEQSRPAPCDMYSACKTSVKYISEVYCRQHHIPFNWIRLTSVYGPGRYGDNILSYTIQSFYKGKPTAYTKLEQQWDYIYIEDAVQGILSIYEHGIPYVDYPLGNGNAAVLSDYIKIIKKVMKIDRELGIGKLPYKLGKPDSCVIDMSRLQMDTGFVCKVPFEEGIKYMIEDMWENLG